MQLRVLTAVRTLLPLPNAPFCARAILDMFLPFVISCDYHLKIGGHFRRLCTCVPVYTYSAALCDTGKYTKNLCLKHSKLLGTQTETDVHVGRDTNASFIVI
jgi:hypothetical protein